MPKRKWNRLHDDCAIDRERTHRSQRLGERRQARSEIVEALAAPGERSPADGEPEAAGEASPTAAAAAKRDD